MEHVFNDLDRLIFEREDNLIFKNETGYICIVDQGPDLGYHIHAVIFFNGAKVCRDIYKAKQIGELRGKRCPVFHGAYSSGWSASLPLCRVSQSRYLLLARTIDSEHKNIYNCLEAALG